jgi:hypothetical protein
MVIDCLHLGFTTQNTWQVVIEAYTDPMKMVVQSSIGFASGMLNASGESPCCSPPSFAAESCTTVALAVEGFFAW